MKPKVFITRKVSEEITQKLGEVCEVEMWEEEDTPVPRDILEEKIKEVDGLLCLLTETIDKELLTQAKHLKVVSNMAVGYDNIDIEVANQQGVMVTNTPGILTETTADLTFALLMATARRIVEASDYLHQGEWKTWSPMQLTGQDVFGATIGIVGMGRIGEAVVKRAKGFGMDILYHNRSRKLETEKQYGVIYVELDHLLRESDFVVILTPYTSETKNLIAQRELALMKETAILINTARGGIVDEKALYQALKGNEIWAAGLDVFEKEPVSLQKQLLTLPNVVTLPHIGSASINTRIRMAQMAAVNLLNGLTNKSPVYSVV
ncbi:2-hydroxyacid dehydrogenase [Virgibacillus sp. DJP39]|uniref:2-hydroxyacid dehydrogenase n=1 Tax=Virgibacillus sp. DJP39 TaxID=3409790 RepID=UPI003BB4F5C2